MTLTDSIVDATRCRLRNHERISKTTGLNRAGGLVFGLVFVALGMFIALLGLGGIPADPSYFHAPRSVITAAGFSFVAGGATIWRMVYQEQRLNQRRQVLAKRHPYSVAFTDYPWDPTGITKSPWPPVLYLLGVVIYMTILLVTLNWWAWFSDRGLIMVKMITVLFDTILLTMAFFLIRRVLIALKYGVSRLEYPTFPVVIGRPVELTWFPPARLKNIRKIIFVLRCVEERCEGDRNGEFSELIHEQLWAATRMTKGPVLCSSAYPVSLSFDLSLTAIGTNLADKLRITFWELEVIADAAGLNYQERYLVPIYRSTT
jgi:hypothetical protein